ncbi:hypothetical protein BEH94_08745 [Candidatus Altiarchaeales archaeon WOR_SM1_SCG]|nr:hypothetical protein BEH94_08745 [Candidatus Altiarchaeales archaeon WOR_SM1_SCG]
MSKILKGVLLLAVLIIVAWVFTPYQFSSVVSQIDFIWDEIAEQPKWALVVPIIIAVIAALVFWRFPYQKPGEITLPPLDSDLEKSEKESFDDFLQRGGKSYWIDFEKKYITERKEVDEIISKLEKDPIHLIIGDPSSGKSFIAKNIGYKSLKKIWFFRDDVFIIKIEKKKKLSAHDLSEILKINKENTLLIIDDVHSDFEGCDDLLDKIGEPKFKILLCGRSEVIKRKIELYPETKLGKRVRDEKTCTKIYAYTAVEDIFKNFENKSKIKIKEEHRVSLKKRYGQDLWILSRALNFYKNNDCVPDREELCNEIKEKLTNDPYKKIHAEDIILPISLFYRHEESIAMRTLTESLELDKEDNIWKLIDYGEIIETDGELSLHHSSRAKLYLETFKKYEKLGEKVKETIQKKFSGWYIGLYHLYFRSMPKACVGALSWLSEEDKDITSATEKDMYLFRLDISYKKYLKSFKVDEPLRKIFNEQLRKLEHNKIFLSSSARIFRINEKSWEINDGAKVYMIKEYDEQLNIQKSIICELLKDDDTKNAIFENIVKSMEIKNTVNLNDVLSHVSNRTFSKEFLGYFSEEDLLEFLNNSKVNQLGPFLGRKGYYSINVQKAYQRFSEDSLLKKMNDATLDEIRVFIRGIGQVKFERDISKGEKLARGVIEKLKEVDTLPQKLEDVPLETISFMIKNINDAKSDPNFIIDRIKPPFDISQKLEDASLETIRHLIKNINDGNGNPEFIIDLLKPPFNLIPKLEEGSLNDINMLIMIIDRPNTSNEPESNSELIIDQIKQMDQNKLIQKIEESTLQYINHFIINIKRNDVDASNYIFELIKQIDLTEKLKESNLKEQQMFIQNVMDDESLYHKYGEIIEELAHNKSGDVLKELNRFEEAEKEYREAIRINPEFALARNNLGNLLQILERYEESEKELREAIKIHPDFALAHTNLGNLFSETGKTKEAKQELEIALKLFKEHGRKEDVKKCEELLKNLNK